MALRFLPSNKDCVYGCGQSKTCDQNSQPVTVASQLATWFKTVES